MLDLNNAFLSDNYLIWTLYLFDGNINSWILFESLTEIKGLCLNNLNETLCSLKSLSKVIDVIGSFFLLSKFSTDISLNQRKFSIYFCLTGRM